MLKLYESCWELYYSENGSPENKLFIDYNTTYTLCPEDDKMETERTISATWDNIEDVLDLVKVDDYYLENTHRGRILVYKNCCSPAVKFKEWQNNPQFDITDLTARFTCREVHPSLEYIFKKFSAEDAITYLKERGMNVCWPGFLHE